MEFWADAVIDVGLAALWLSGLAARRLANALEWVAIKADPDEKPDDDDDHDD